MCGTGHAASGKGLKQAHHADGHSTAGSNERRAHANKDKHKAAVANHHRKDRAMRKLHAALALVTFNTASLLGEGVWYSFMRANMPYERDTQWAKLEIKPAAIANAP